MPETINFRPNNEDEEILQAIIKRLELSSKQPAYWTAAIRYALRYWLEQNKEGE